MRNILLALFFIPHGFLFAQGKLVISEISPSDPVNDWIELEYRADSASSINVSRLYVTGYYGKDEPLSGNPVTLYSEDNPATPYDERFCVVIFAEGVDETDLTGDTNRNGILELYVNATPLRSTESAVALDADSEPANGMIDFFAFDTDEITGNSLASYIASAVASNEWSAANSSPFHIASINGRSIARKNADRNCAADFALTSLQTPGRSNCFGGTGDAEKLIRVSRKNLLEPWRGTTGVQITVLAICSLKMRIYSPDGMLVYESPLLSELAPGVRIVEIKQSALKKLKSGIYFIYLSATSDELKASRNVKSVLVISRYR